MNGHSINPFAINPFGDLEGLDFHVKVGNAARTGAKNLTGTGWPGLRPSPPAASAALTAEGIRRSGRAAAC